MKLFKCFSYKIGKNVKYCYEMLNISLDSKKIGSLKADAYIAVLFWKTPKLLNNFFDISHFFSKYSGVGWKTLTVNLITRLKYIIFLLVDRPNFHKTESWHAFNIAFNRHDHSFVFRWQLKKALSFLRTHDL